MTKTTALLTLLALGTCLLLGTIIGVQRLQVNAIFVQLFLFAVVLSIASSGLYLLAADRPLSLGVKRGMVAVAALFVSFAALTVFDVIPFKKGAQGLIGLGIVYVTLVELYLLKWRRSKSEFAILGMVALIANGYLIAFFLFRLSARAMGVFFDGAVILSLICFLIGCFAARRTEKAPSEAVRKREEKTD